MRKILKITLITFIVLIIAIAAFSVSVFFKYRSVEKQNLQPKLINTKTYSNKANLPKDLPVPGDKLALLKGGTQSLPVMGSGENVTLGDSLLVEFQVQCPWNKRPLEADVSPGKGSQLLGAPEFVKIKTKWGYTVWNVLFKVQPYLTGNIPEGDATVNFIPGIDGNSDQLTLKIPAFTSVAIPNVKGELLVAPRVNSESQLQSSKTKYFWRAAIAVVLIIILLYWFVFRKSKEKEKPLTPWALALLNLKGLNDGFFSGNLSAVKCMTNLTDIVRNYLEDRFFIQAPRQTTEEFLRKMEDRNSPLSNQDRNFLRDFMTSADMIKFAKYEAPKAEVETAIARAEQLVNETIPNSEEEKGTK